MLQPVLRERLQAMAAFSLVVCLAFTATTTLGFHTWHKLSAIPSENLEISALQDQTGSTFADGTRKRSADGNDLPKELAVRQAPCGADENTSPVPHSSSDSVPQMPLFGATPIRAPPSCLPI